MIARTCARDAATAPGPLEGGVGRVARLRQLHADDVTAEANVRGGPTEDGDADGPADAQGR
jgi:hypothetical protein